MIRMGRTKTVFKDLPPNMVGRRKGRRIYYYYKVGSRKIPLGQDLARARLLWADLKNGGGASNNVSFVAVAERWEREEITKGRGPKTQSEYRSYLVSLKAAFREFKVDDIRPAHVRQYLNERPGKVLANREKSLLSVIFQWARENDLTEKANPCAGVKRNRETPRTVYVTDAMLAECYERAEQPLKDALDIMPLIGQRPGDTLRIRLPDAADEFIELTQSKTGARLRIRIEGRLKEVIDRIRSRPRPVKSVYLIADDNDGQPLTVGRLSDMQRRARGDATWQMRDIRAKTATESENLKDAQLLLGHSSEVTTAAVYRRMRGTTVKPLK